MSSTIPRQRHAETAAGQQREPAAQGHAGAAPAAAQSASPANWTDSPRQLKQGQQIAQLQGAETPSASPGSGGLPAGLRAGIESLSGLDMSGVRVHRNSSKPAALQAHAYAQGQDIHLGPGQEKHLPHEAWHVVQQAQGRVRPTMQMKRGVAVNDDAGLEREADLMGAKALQMKPASGDGPGAQGLSAPRFASSQGPAQRVQSVIVGENHGEPKVTVERKKTGIFSGNPGSPWTMSAEPSKLAAALIHHNGFAAPGGYQAELERQMNINGGLKAVMTTAEDISTGTNAQWGAEDNLIGVGSSAINPGKVGVQNKRTHIENPEVRANAAFLRYLSQIGGHTLPKSVFKAGFPNASGYQILTTNYAGAVNTAEHYLGGGASVTVQQKWSALKAPGAPLGQVVPRIPGIVVTDESNVSTPVLDAQESWTSQTLANVETGFTEILQTTVDAITANLGDGFKQPLDSSNPSRDTLIQTIAGLKYGSPHAVLSRMHAVASAARTLTQLKGMHTQNQAYQAANTHEVNAKTGYIVGDSHLTDLEEIKKQHNTADSLKTVMDNATIVRRSAYGNLKLAAQNAVTATNRSDTLKIS